MTRRIPGVTITGFINDKAYADLDGQRKLYLVWRLLFNLCSITVVVVNTTKGR